MKEFIEKLIGRLEEQKDKYFDECFFQKIMATEDTIEIINELAEEYKNTSIITDFLQYARDNADNYDTNEGWPLADLIDLSIKYSEEYINTSTDTSTTNADAIRSMTDEELAEFLGGIDHTIDDCEFIVKIGDEWLHDSTADILDWLQSEVEGVTENE